jgi:hypothetical protein
LLLLLLNIALGEKEVEAMLTSKNKNKNKKGILLESKFKLWEGWIDTHNPHSKGLHIALVVKERVDNVFRGAEYHQFVEVILHVNVVNTP